MTPNEVFEASMPGCTTDASPTIDVYLPEVVDTCRTGVVILPGGGYGGLAEHEGLGYAEFLVAHGIPSFVVTYRLGSSGHRHPAMIEDALAAIYSVRQRADEWGIDADGIGIMGSSAGGHLAATSLIGWDRYPSAKALRPDFGILCYPVIAMRGPHAHMGSRKNLLGEEAADTVIDEVTPDLHVSAETPPCFLWHTGEDKGVPLENSLIFAAALRDKDIPFELHLYAEGVHGLGLRTDLPWGEACVRWLRALRTSAASST